MKSGEGGTVLIGIWFPFDILYSRSHDIVVGKGRDFKQLLTRGAVWVA